MDYATLESLLEQTSIIELGALDSKLVKRLAKVIPHDLRREIDKLEEKQYKEQHVMLTGRQITLRIFSFFDITKTQGRALGGSDLRNIQLHSDNLRLFNQSWEEMLLTLDKNYGRRTARDLVQQAAREVFTHEELSWGTLMGTA